MFRRIVITLLSGFGAVAAAATAPNYSETSVAGKLVRVEYEASQAGVDDLFETIAPGDVWSLGAISGASVSSEASLIVGADVLESGSYRLFVHRVDDSSWQLLVNAGGSEHRGYDSALDVASVPLDISEGAMSHELTIRLTPLATGLEMSIRWRTHLFVTWLGVAP